MSFHEVVPTETCWSVGQRSTMFDTVHRRPLSSRSGRLGGSLYFVPSCSLLRSILFLILDSFFSLPALGYFC